jgi:ABC-type multidrug transport system fused ATPase/permease subunit
MKINVTAWTVYVSRWLFSQYPPNKVLQLGLPTTVNLRLMDLIIVSTALFLILTKPGMTGAAAGFILAFAVDITTNVNWVLLNLRTFELKGVSLERTAEYRNLETEGGERLDDSEGVEVGAGALEYDTVHRQLANWPDKGRLEIKDLRARYAADLPDILHDVSFDVEGGQRVGIVGATGGGKSTLAKAFFSFVDVNHGYIKIDDKGGAHVMIEIFS